MRRPLKPFVTEYRGGARRQAGVQNQMLKAELGKAESASAEPRQPEQWPAPPAPIALPQDDTYEAALRAADALFASRARQRGHAAADPSSAHGEAHGEASASPSTAGGRILRAIEEPPSPELARLEAEFAPKRRGRKPGSKNKPKVASEGLEAIEAPAPGGGVADEIQAAPVAPGPPVPVALPATALRPAARGARFAWVRTKLKPGQQWKRRIPKVAW